MTLCRKHWKKLNRLINVKLLARRSVIGNFRRSNDHYDSVSRPINPLLLPVMQVIQFLTYFE